MYGSASVVEAFSALNPNDEELKSIHDSYDKASFNGFPPQLGNQHMWLETLSNIFDCTIKTLRQNKGYSLKREFQDKALYERIYYLKILYNKVLKRSAGDLSCNVFARVYEFNVLQLAKWVIFKDSEKKFERFLRKLDTHC